MSHLQEEAGMTEQEYSLPDHLAQADYREPEAEEEEEDHEAEDEEAEDEEAQEAEAAEAYEAEEKSHKTKDSGFRRRAATASLRLPVDRRLVGLLIGPKGATIRAIETLTRTRISIKTEGTKHSVYIYGSYEACGRGLDVVQCVLGWY